MGYRPGRAVGHKRAGGSADSTDRSERTGGRPRQRAGGLAQHTDVGRPGVRVQAQAGVDHLGERCGKRRGQGTHWRERAGADVQFVHRAHVGPIDRERPGDDAPADHAGCEDVRAWTGADSAPFVCRRVSSRRDSLLCAAGRGVPGLGQVLVRPRHFSAARCDSRWHGAWTTELRRSVPIRAPA